MTLTEVKRATAAVPATCGELLQGVDGEGPVLVSLPVDVWGTVEVALVEEPVIDVTPNLQRASAALGLALDRAGWPGGAVVGLGGEVPRGHGMGSSTVDVAGIIAAVCAAAGVALAEGELVRLMTQVEPSDSSPLAGLWAIDHVAGSRALHLGGLPARWTLVAVDSGETVATADVHRACGAGPQIHRDTVATTRWHDPHDVARIATESAIRNQERLPHPAFAAVRRIAARTGALGVAVAHSGSLCAAICVGAAQAATTRDALAAEGLRPTVFRAAAPGLRVSTTTRRLDASAHKPLPG